MANYLKFDLGPNQLLPTLDWRFMPPPDHYRSSGSATMNQYFLGITMETNTSPYLMIGGNEMPYPTGVDPDGVWHNICGILLYETDGFGTKTYTGYNLVWQYHCETWVAQGDSGVVQLRIRLIKIKFDDPLDVTQICSYLRGFGNTNFDRRDFYFVGIQVAHNYDAWVGAGIGYVGYNKNTGEKAGNNYVTIGVSTKGFSEYLHADDTIGTTDDPNAGDPDYPSRPGGGDGNHDRNSDPISVPSLPSVEGIDCGLMTLYYGNSMMIRAFLSNIWVTSIADAIKQFFQQPMDFIVGAMILPLASQLTAATVGNARPVFNNIPFESALPYVETQYYEIDCGVLDIEPYWGSCFDYDPYTKIQIFLPYIGYRELLADEVMGHNIYCKYHIDACTGDCVAFVGVSAVGPTGPDIEKVLGQFNGNCGVKIPINSQSYDGAVAAGISMACTFAGIGLSMGLEAAGLGDAQSVDATKVLGATSASVISNMKPNVARSGMFGQSAGYMGCRTPFIIKRIPRQSLPENYIDLRGYPSNVFGTLGSLSGFAAVEDIQLNNIPAMEDERKEILEWLKGGVLI